MNPSVALIVCGIGVAGLLFLARDEREHTSKAVWLPVIWMWIHGSRPVSVWFGMTKPRMMPGELPEASALDQLIVAVILVSGVAVLTRRRTQLAEVLKRAWPLALYFCFCLVSLLWSDFPAWGFKRWLRAIGELAMVLILATEAEPASALRRFLSRVGFVLVPASLLLIKYYPGVGRGYDQWGIQANTGVTEDKNILGAVTFVVGLGTLWVVLRLLSGKKERGRARRLLAQGILLASAVRLLFEAHSATSGGSFVLGSALMLIAALPPLRRRPAAVHAFVLVMALGGGLAMLLGGWDHAVKTMGRDTGLTGRTDVWRVLSNMSPNPPIGAGFETFWLGPRVAQLNTFFLGINEAHNGYLEIYLNLGYVGLASIALLVGHSYRRAVASFRRDPILGGLLVAYVVAMPIYSITEAGFRMLGPTWFFLMLTAAFAGRLSLPGSRPLKSGTLNRY